MEAHSKYQVFTPSDIVDMMLDLAGYKGDLRGKVFYESTFGRGDILVAAVRRYIDGAIRNGASACELGKCLERDFIGFEIDRVLFEQCTKRLDNLVESYGISGINWNLRCEDALFSDAVKPCHFAVGNPPYLEYKRIPSEARNRIRRTYECSREGRFDYYYSFLEQAYGLLVDGGALIQLVPGSVLKNASARCLRDLFHPGLAYIVEFPGGKVFDGVMVAPVIVKVLKGAKTQAFTYENPHTQTTRILDKRRLGKKWSFSNKTIGGDVTLSTLAHAYMPVATLCNEAFVVGEGSDIEKDILRDAASPRKLRSGAKEYIIFPYRMQDDGSVVRLEDEDFRHEYPKAYEHLARFTSRLRSRSADKGAQWFEYGRSQSLQNLNERRILISTVVTEKVRTYELAPGVVPYGGMVIAPRTDDCYDLTKSILESDDFASYARNIGTGINGSSVRITSRDVNDYPIPRGIGKGNDGAA